MPNLKFAFLGSSELSIYVLEELLKLGYPPALIVTLPGQPRGRGLNLQDNIVKTWAEEKGLPVLIPAKFNSEETEKILAQYDMALVASFGKIISERILLAPKKGILNIHPSLLPKYRGPSPIQAQILADEKEIGVSIIKLDKEVDHGQLLAQEKLPKVLNLLKEPINFNELEKITAIAGAKLFVKISSDYLENKIKLVEQNHTGATFTKKIEKNDGLLDLEFDKPYDCYLKTLAYSDWPGTFFFLPPRHQNATPPKKGGDEAKEKKLRVIIKESEYKDGAFYILKVLPEGKKEMPYDDFLRGLK